MTPRLARLLYTIVFTLALPLVFASLLWRSRRLPAYRRHWGERLGRYKTPRPSGPLIWIHAVSVGETSAAQPLIDALQARYPDCALLITHMTPTGRATSVQLFGDRVLRAYLPYDLPWAMQRFLRHFQPGLGILMETEVWPNLVAQCARAHVPLVLANARLSEKSLAKALRRSALINPAVQGLDRILAQTPADAERLRALGASRVIVTGNVKFDIEPPAAQRALGQAFRQCIGTRPVLLAASTREGEEVLLLDAWLAALGQSSQQGLPAQSAHSPSVSAQSATAQPGPAPLLAIVPRHPQRFDEVADLVRARQLTLQRRSGEQSAQTVQTVDPATQVWLGDSMGEMFAYYAAADVAFVGGSLLPFGGQNLIEACAVGCPVLIGPHTFNFAQVSADAVASGAALRVADAEALLQAVLELFRDAARRAAMADNAAQFAAAHRGATAHTLRELSGLIDAARAAD